MADPDGETVEVPAADLRIVLVGYDDLDPASTGARDNATYLAAYHRLYDLSHIGRTADPS